LFPTASILLITTTITEITVKSFAAVKGRLEPAREVISQFLDVNGECGDTSRPVLLHIFSHGGSNIGTQLVRSIREDSLAKHERFVSALRLVIFDCCPGNSAFIRQYNAAAVSLPSAENYPIRNLLGKAILYPSIGLLSVLQAAKVVSDVEGLRTELNEPSLFGSSARRLYLYSVEDEMVRWEDVERHMEHGRERGYLVHGERFERGAHCALVMLNEERYWESVQRAWEGVEERPARESRL
jgi:hypothetical protein